MNANTNNPAHYVDAVETREIRTMKTTNPDATFVQALIAGEIRLPEAGAAEAEAEDRAFTDANASRIAKAHAFARANAKPRTKFVAVG